MVSITPGMDSKMGDLIVSSAALRSGLRTERKSSTSTDFMMTNYSVMRSKEYEKSVL